MSDRTSRGFIDYETGTEREKPRKKRQSATMGDVGIDLFAPVTPAARTNDPATSNEGIHDVLPRAGSQQIALLDAFANHPMGLTAEEAGRIAGLSHTGFWKRVSDLLRKGYIEDTHTTRLATTGSDQRVLAITQTGKEALCAVRPR